LNDKKASTQQHLPKSGGSVVKSSYVLRIMFSAGRQFSAHLPHGRQGNPL